MPQNRVNDLYGPENWDKDILVRRWYDKNKQITILMDFKFISYNCRSVTNCHYSVTELTCLSDVVCLQETWLPAQESSVLFSKNTLSYI